VTSDDPLIHAGHVRCSTCRTASWPTDADWISETLILASYEAACEHATPHTWIVDATAGPDPAAALFCSGRTATGALCRNKPRPGTTRCHWHPATADQDR